jgi:hypothetical protein
MAIQSGLEHEFGEDLAELLSPGEDANSKNFNHLCIDVRDVLFLDILRDTFFHKV